jgi:hypothetical protein
MSDVVRLKITLVDTDPPIWRRVEVPSAITLKDLHSIIQAAMGWQNSHLYQFHVGRQIIDGPGFVDVGFSGQTNITAGRVGLDAFVESKVKRFVYLYDMGDGWEHELRVEKVLPADPDVRYPRFIDGAGACPPEDVGGPPGFYAFLEAIQDRKHPDHEDMLDWCGGRYDPANLDEAHINKRLARLGPRKKRKDT